MFSSHDRAKILNLPPYHCYTFIPIYPLALFSESILLPGKDYLYQFESEAGADGTTNDKSKIYIKCEVAISHTTKCFYSLQLKNCIVNAAGGPPESETAWIADQHFPDLSKYLLPHSH
ncbi:apolipoprotein B-100 [Trichonephila clavipes]|nr:apolipoprotein B-100 [Trichonephila clavipes]